MEVKFIPPTSRKVEWPAGTWAWVRFSSSDPACKPNIEVRYHDRDGKIMGIDGRGTIYQMGVNAASYDVLALVSKITFE